MEYTATENEIEDQVPIEMENNDDDDDLIFKVSPLFASIKAGLRTLSPQSCCIYRVPGRLRKVNEEAYTPHLISIGPFHYGEERFQNMEEYKLRYLKAFLVRTRRSLAHYLKTVLMWEQEARDYYSETIHLSSDEFVKMILVDGSFIVEYLLRVNRWAPFVEVFHKPWMGGIVFSDMILLENQLPFFVLERFFKSVCPEDFRHYEILLEFVHNCCRNISKLPELRGIISPCDMPGTISPCDIKHLVDYIHRVYVSSIPGIPHYRGGYKRPPTVTQLHQAGIKFKKGTSISLFDIKFSNNGILEIPQLTVDDLAESWFRNLIAFEQCHSGYYTHLSRKCIFSDYFSLLDGMIDTSKDVDLLVHSEIIRNMLSSSEEASTLINNIGKYVCIDSDDFYFSDICRDLNAYCKSRCHKWIATLKRDYFGTPWAFISFIAAVLLIVLTSIQSICSIISL